MVKIKRITIFINLIKKFKHRGIFKLGKNLSCKNGKKINKTLNWKKKFAILKSTLIILYHLLKFKWIFF